MYLKIDKYERHSPEWWIAELIDCPRCKGTGHMPTGHGELLHGPRVLVSTSYEAQAEFVDEDTGEFYRSTPFGSTCWQCGGDGKLLLQDGKAYKRDLICGEPMYSDFAHKKQDRVCNMHKGHRGRHCSVAWYCDACSKAQRGQPAAWGQDGEFTVPICFMCAERIREEPIHDPWPEPYDLAGDR